MTHNAATPCDEWVFRREEMVLSLGGFELLYQNWGLITTVGVQETGDLRLTALIPPLEGIDPDDAFSSVPYEKVSLLSHRM